MLTKKQHQLLMFIKAHQNENGISPSFEEMKVALGLNSKSGIHRLISALEERGFLRRLAHRARAIEIIKLPESIILKPEQRNLPLGDVSKAYNNPMNAANDAGVEIPLHGRIAAGTPIEALESSDKMIMVPSTMIGAGKHFALEVEGDSMIELGILDGDTAIIRQVNNANNGDVVVALIDNNEATLKTLHKRGHQIALKPSNVTHSTQIYPANQVLIQGKLVGIQRQY
ncbi:MAG: transcriptional repressor LexA [Sphingomonadales bacterium]